MSGRKSSQPLIETVERLAKEKLSQMGFRRREPGIFTLDLGNDFLGTVGLNRAVGRGEGWLLINPFIGVRYQNLERKLAELEGAKWDSYAPPTISRQLGYLMPGHEFRSWSLSIDESPDSAIDDMMKAVETYGIAFMKENASLASILDRLSSFDYTTAYSRSYRLPLAYLFRGERDRALALVQEKLKTLENKTDAGADYYRNFAKRFSEFAASQT